MLKALKTQHGERHVSRRRQEKKHPSVQERQTDCGRYTSKQNPPGATHQTTQTGRQEKKSNTGEGKLLRSEFNSQETLDKWIQSSSLRKNTKTRLTFEKTKQKKKFGQDQWFNETKELSGRCVYCWTWTQTKGQHCLWRVEGVAVDVLPVNKSHKHSCFCFCT